jgi:WD40 repeat protein
MAKNKMWTMRIESEVLEAEVDTLGSNVRNHTERLDEIDTLLDVVTKEVRQYIFEEIIKSDDIEMAAGVIITSGSKVQPEGYIQLNGQALNRVTYSALFEAIGENFGEGNGTTTFNVPKVDIEQMVSTNGSFIYSASEDREVHKHDPTSLEAVGKYKGHTLPVRRIVKKDSNLYSCSDDTQIHKIDAATMTELIIYRDFTLPVSSMSVGHDGNLYAGGFDKIIHKIDSTTMTKLDSYNFGKVIRDIKCDPDNDFMFVCGEDEIHKIDIINMVKVAGVQSNRIRICCLAVSNKFLFSGSHDTNIIKHDINDLSPLEIYQDHDSKVVSMTFGGDGNLYSVDPTIVKKIEVNLMKTIDSYDFKTYGNLSIILAADATVASAAITLSVAAATAASTADVLLQAAVVAAGTAAATDAAGSAAKAKEAGTLPFIPPDLSGGIGITWGIDLIVGSTNTSLHRADADSLVTKKVYLGHNRVVTDILYPVLIYDYYKYMKV